MILVCFYKEVRALLRFRSHLKKGAIDKASKAYQEYEAYSNEVEDLLSDQLEDAKETFAQHEREVARMKEVLA